jgi:hypothetical protein
MSKPEKNSRKEEIQNEESSDADEQNDIEMTIENEEEEISKEHVKQLMLMANSIMNMTELMSKFSIVVKGLSSALVDLTERVAEIEGEIGIIKEDEEEDKSAIRFTIDEDENENEDSDQGLDDEKN